MIIIALISAESWTHGLKFLTLPLKNHLIFQNFLKNHSLQNVNGTTAVHNRALVRTNTWVPWNLSMFLDCRFWSTHIWKGKRSQSCRNKNFGTYELKFLTRALHRWDKLVIIKCFFSFLLQLKCLKIDRKSNDF